jgi:hypothetical protein
MLKRLVAFRVHAQTKVVHVETPIFSEAYNNGIFEQPFRQWEIE